MKGLSAYQFILLTVYGISEYRMPDMSKMDPDLMRSSRLYDDLNECGGLKLFRNSIYSDRFSGFICRYRHFFSVPDTSSYGDLYLSGFILKDAVRQSCI